MPTSASGLGGYVATATAAVCGAATALRLVDAVAALRARARPWAAAGARSTTRAQTGVAAAPLPEATTPKAAIQPPSCEVAVASLRRPCFEALLAQELAVHPTVLIAGAGPEPMLADLELAISALHRGGVRAPHHRMVRLTHSM